MRRPAPSKPLDRRLLRAVAAYLERDAGDLHASFYSPRDGRVTPHTIREEVARVRRWASVIRQHLKHTARRGSLP